MTPTPAPQRRGSHDATAARRRAAAPRHRPILGAVLAAVFIVASAGFVAQPAFADQYPSWQDVQNAKANEAAAAAQVGRIQALIASLQTQVAQTQAEAEKRGEEFQVAQEKADAADRKADALVTKATDARSKSDEATTQAGRLAAQLYRSGNSGITANVLLSGGRDAGKTDRLLADLGSMTKLVEQSDGVYKTAIQARNLSSSLSAQADVAKTARAQLEAEAQAAMDAAVAAATAAKDALTEQQTQILTLQAQLAALQDTTATTVEQYQAGVAARAAAARAAGGGNLPGGFVGPQGWANPVSGVITAGFGARQALCAGCSTYHEGIDVGSTCGNIEYAAHDGTVVYAGPYGAYGNYIRIDHGGGVTTAYGHIMNGGILVGVGQRVGAGEPISKVGSTGHSTGCHLHFEVRINGSPINGAVFMAQRGAPLG